MRRLPILIVVGVAAVSAFGATPVAQTAEPVAVSIVEPPLKPPPTWTYEPKVVTVKVGTEVTWTNNGAVVHTVSADDGRQGDVQFHADDAGHLSVSLQTASLDEGRFDRPALKDGARDVSGPRRFPAMGRLGLGKA